jgi:hypothetical protein
MRPTEQLLVIAALANPHVGTAWDSDGWRFADDIRGQLARLGYETTSRLVGAHLHRLAREDLPLIETRRRLRVHEYRVTQYGKTFLRNTLGAASF